MDTLARSSGIGIPHTDEAPEVLGVPEPAHQESDEAPTTMALPTATQAWGLVAARLGRSSTGTAAGAARRRRRVLVLLAVGLAASLGASLAGVLPGATPAIFVGLLVSYLTVLIRQALRAGDSGAAHNPQTDQYREASRRASEQARRLIAEQQADGRQSTRGWDAVPTTLPTYVSKPKASKVPRVVDLTAPGRQWTGEAMVQRAQEERRKVQIEAAQAQFDREMSVLERDPVTEVAELANPVDHRSNQRSAYRRAANG